MTPIKARQRAVVVITACFDSEQAGGFEGCNLDDDWMEEVVDIHSLTATAFRLRIGGHDILFRASIVKPKGK